MNDPQTPFYVTSGTIKPGTESYIVRHADEALYDAIVAGEFCYVLTARQMGKSSLMARTAARLAKDNFRTAQLDLTLIGADKKSVTAERWYYGVAFAIQRGLKLNISLYEWWQERKLMPPLQRFTEFLDLVLYTFPGKVVIFVDEIDSTIGLSFCDDFFAAIRACCNRRSTNLEFRRLTFVLLGVATPAQLISDPSRTPFNIGKGVELMDFSSQEAEVLAKGLDENDAAGRALLSRILYWTDGHPNLTQVLCRHVAESVGRVQESAQDCVDRLVGQIFLSPTAGRNENNLNFVRDRLREGHTDVRKVLKLYEQILRGKPVADKSSSAPHAALKLSGIVKPDAQGNLRVRNRIYKAVFDRAWLRKETPPSRFPVVISTLALAGPMVAWVAGKGWVRTHLWAALLVTLAYEVFLVYLSIPGERRKRLKAPWLNPAAANVVHRLRKMLSPFGTAQETVRVKSAQPPASGSGSVHQSLTGVRRSKDRLGEILVREGLVTVEQVERALAQQQDSKARLGQILIWQEALGEDDLMKALSHQYGVPLVDPEDFDLDPSLMDLAPREVWAQHQALPLSRAASTVTLAMVDPGRVAIMDDIASRLGFNVDPVLASERAIDAAMQKYYSASGASERSSRSQPVTDSREGTGAGEAAASILDRVMDDVMPVNLGAMESAADESPVVKLVDRILEEAINRGASDIHFEPFEREYRVRLRIDGVLHDFMMPPLKLRDSLTSRIKIMAKLDISEKRLPQDGRIEVKLAGEGRRRQVDFRVSTMPTLYGEGVSLHAMDKGSLRLDLTQLGFEPGPLARFVAAIEKRQGIVLVAGPARSGKTTTLYAAITRLNSPGVNIVTAEDPVEFELPGISQSQIKEQIGLNFAAALRAFLRHDTDVILVGELRDFETAELAVKAALNGHTLLSSMNTLDAPSTISRLVNMGLEPFAVATSVNLISAQRLLRRICPRCKEPEEVSAQSLIDLGFTDQEAQEAKNLVSRGKGCEFCGNTGYRGRVALFEVLEVTDALRAMILTGSPAADLKRQAMEEGMLTLRQSGLNQVKAGLTTLEEVVRETVS